MCKKFCKLFILMVFILITGCARKLDNSSLPATINLGDIYYTQVSMQYEKNRFPTTNYRRGVLLPINSQVQIQEVTDRSIKLDILPAQTPLRIDNVAKHTGDTIAQTLVKLLSKKKVDLSQFSALERQNILAGKVAKTMQKKAVIAAIGYPPITETPSLASNQWTYWSARFNRFVVYFENDRVIRIQD